MTLPLIPCAPTEHLIDDPTGRVAERDYMTAIRAAITNHPRSLQKRIGPSEIGHPCARRLGYKLLGAPEVNQFPDVPWKPTVGTAVHAWAEDAFHADNAHDDEHLRWLIESRVDVGEVGGVAVTGSADLFDRHTGTVIDHKVVGKTQLTKYRAKGPGQQYRAQAHLYGRGFARRGLRVRRVMIAFLPRDGELKDAYIWSEPYDEQVALDALQRVEGIHLATATIGVAALAALATADAFCSRCPYFKRGSTDPAAGCPGDQEAVARSTSAPVLSLAGPS